MVAGKVAESELGVDGKTRAVIKLIALAFHVATFNAKTLLYFTFSQ
jgi:hypothetical protein